MPSSQCSTSATLPPRPTTLHAPHPSLHPLALGSQWLAGFNLFTVQFLSLLSGLEARGFTMALGLWLMELPLTYSDLSPLFQPHQSLCFPSNPNVLSGAPGPLCFLLPQPEATPSPTKVGFPTVLCAKFPSSSPLQNRTHPVIFFPFLGKILNFYFPPDSICHSLQVCPKCYFFLGASVGLLGLRLARERDVIQFRSFPAQTRL